MPVSVYLRKGRLAVSLLATVLVTSSCGMALHYMKNGFVSAPPASEFGLGPRKSAAGTFTATVTPAKPFTVGPLHAVRLELVDAAGNPVNDAEILINGGMPQHGHGLPTKPRITSTEPNGVYVVEGVRFNMGGWWELKFAVSSKAAKDSVTFNIRL
jgi:hypothetical protein